MVDIADIPDFPGQPGQKPEPGTPTPETPIGITLVTAPLDREYVNIATGSAAVDAYIAAEIVAGRARQVTVERWSPWSPLQIEIGYGSGAGYNYGRFEIDGRSWYAFLDADYLNLATTLYTPTVDAWTTYGPTIGYSMIERGHVAVAASQGDTYGDQYLTAPEPIEAPPVDGILAADILGSHPSDWTVVVISANDLRGAPGGNFFAPHVNALQIAQAADVASSATVDSSGTVQQTIPDAIYPWTDGVLTTGGADPSTDIYSASNPPPNGAVPDAYLTDRQGIPLAGDTAKAFDEANTASGGILTIAQPAGGYRSLFVQQDMIDNPGDYNLDPTSTIGLATPGTSSHGTGNRVDINGGAGRTWMIAHASEHGFVQEFGSADPGHFKYQAETYPLVGVGSIVGPNVVVPVVTPSPMSTIDGVAAGGGVYLFTPSGFAEYMTIMQGASWVVQGISDVRLAPSWAVGTGGASGFTPTAPTTDPGSDLWQQAAAIPAFVGALTTSTASGTVLDGWRETVLAAYGAQMFRKLVTSQFSDILLSGGDGFAHYRPDQWRASGVGYTAVSGAAHGDPTLRLLPSGYNEMGDQEGVDSVLGGRGGHAMSGYGIAAANTAVQVMSPYLAAYSSKQNWQSNVLNKNLAIELGIEKVQLNAGVQGVQTALGILGGAASAAGGAGGGGAALGAAGAGLGAIGGAMGGIASMATAQTVAQNTITLLDVSEDGSFDIGAILLGVSGLISVASFDSWTESLSSVSGTGTGETLASAWRAIVAQGFKAVIAVPSPERIKALLREWGRYGYMIGQAFVPPRLDVMTHFSYWQTREATVLGALPQSDRSAIAAAFDRGVTVWGSVAEIGSQPSNAPVPGVSY